MPERLLASKPKEVSIEAAAAVPMAAVTALQAVRDKGNIKQGKKVLSQLIKTMLLGAFMSIGSKKITFISTKPNAADLKFIIKLVQEGKIKPVIDRLYSLHETAEAIQYLSEGHARGKVVINVVHCTH